MPLVSYNHLSATSLFLSSSKNDAFVCIDIFLFWRLWLFVCIDNILTLTSLTRVHLLWRPWLMYSYSDTPDSCIFTLTSLTRAYFKQTKKCCISFTKRCNQPRLLLAVSDFLGNWYFQLLLLSERVDNRHTIVTVHTKRSAVWPPACESNRNSVMWELCGAFIVPRPQRRLMYTYSYSYA